MKVSIVMTVYNRAQYLPAAIESFLAQTYRQTELLIWDDGSTDSSCAIAQTYAQQNLNITFVAAQHKGQVPTLYDAMETVKGNYVGWLDSDDLLRPTAIEETVAVLDQNPSVGMVYTDHWEIDEQGTIIELGSRSLIPYSPERLLVDFMTFHFRLFRYTTYLEAGKLDRTLKNVGDYDLSLKISEITEVRHLESVLYCYRVHKNSISKQDQQEQIEFTYRAICKALKRRKMDENWTLSVLPGPRFVLQEMLRVDSSN